MLFLVFQLGKDRYALDATRIAEVLPLVDIRPIPQSPPGIAGVCDCRGTPMPVIDLSQLVLGRPAQRWLSTRIVVVHYPDDRNQPRLLGLVAERATEVVRREPADFVPTGITNRGARYLGPVATDDRGLIQRIEVDHLLSGPIRDALFQTSVEA